jgi:hypothetical protein
MKYVILIVSLLLLNVNLHAQDYKLVHTVSCNLDADFTTDPIGSFYIYSKGDITKFNTDGIETARYSSREYGDIGYVDATNPLKVLVVFKEFSKAIVLDAALSPQVTIDLSFPGIPYVNVICTSREDGYWIVDPVSNQIRKINDQLSIVLDGTPFRQVSSNQIEPFYLTDSGNWLIMNTTGFGLLVFDRFGTYYKTIQDIPALPVQAFGHELLYKENDVMTKMDIRTGQSNHFLLPENKGDDICRVEGNRIFLKSQNLLKIYSY